MSEYNIQMNKYNALNAEYDQLYPQPMKHASTHAKDGSDPITPSSIGAAELGADGKVLASQLPSMEVDAYTKVQTLSDTTKTLFGLDATAVPDDALALLSRFQKGLGNEYVWAKTAYTVGAGAVNSSGQSLNAPSGTATAKHTAKFYNTASYINGSIVLSDEVASYEFTYNTFKTVITADVISAMVGKYFYGYDESTWVVDSSTYADAAGNNTCYLRQAAITKTTSTTVGYVNSPDPNAYPPAVSDGYTYTALGQIGRLLNHVGTVSYTGTGASSVTVLTEFKAKFAIISSKSAISTYWRLTFAVGDYGGCSFQIYDGNSAGKMETRVTSSMGDSSITITNVRNEAIDINDSGAEYLLTYFG